MPVARSSQVAFSSSVFRRHAIRIELEALWRKMSACSSGFWYTPICGLSSVFLGTQSPSFNAMSFHLFLDIHWPLPTCLKAETFEGASMYAVQRPDATRLNLHMDPCPHCNLLHLATNHTPLDRYQILVSSPRFYLLVLANQISVYKVRFQPKSTSYGSRLNLVTMPPGLNSAHQTLTLHHIIYDP